VGIGGHEVTLREHRMLTRNPYRWSLIFEMLMGLCRLRGSERTGRSEAQQIKRSVAALEAMLVGVYGPVCRQRAMAD
jgi:hypothetical protein